MKRQKSIRVARIPPNANRSRKLAGKSACRNVVAMLIPTLPVPFIPN
jgi:hypothetical protein